MSREVVFSAGKDITPENKAETVRALKYTLEGEEVSDESLEGILGYYREKYNFEIVSYEKINNARCQEMQEILRKHEFPGESFKVGFHGTFYENIDSIVEEGLRLVSKRYASGHGVYISVDSFEAASYSNENPNANFELAVFLVKFLQGAHMAKGTSGQVQYGKTDGQPIHTLTDGKTVRILKFENQGVVFGLLKMRWIDGTLIDPKQINDNMGGFGNPLLIRHLNDLYMLQGDMLQGDSLKEANKLKTTFDTMMKEEDLLKTLQSKVFGVRKEFGKRLSANVKRPKSTLKTKFDLDQHFSTTQKLQGGYYQLQQWQEELTAMRVNFKNKRLERLEFIQGEVLKLEKTLEEPKPEEHSEEHSGEQSGEKERQEQNQSQEQPPPQQQDVVWKTETSSLRPKDHFKVDERVKIVKAENNFAEILGKTGTIRFICLDSQYILFVELDEAADGTYVAEEKDKLKSYQRHQPWSYDPERKHMYRARVGHLERLIEGCSSQKPGEGGGPAKNKPDSGDDPQGSSSQGGTSQERKPGEGGGPAKKKQKK